MVRKLEYWTKLDEMDRAAILALPHAVKSFDPHAYIVREGDVTTTSCIMLSGYSIRHKLIGDGSRQIVAFT